MEMNAEMLRQMFDYNAETGQFINRRSMPGLTAGTEAGCKAGPGKNKYLGSFATAEEAGARYLAAKRVHHPGNTLGESKDALDAAGTGSHGEPATAPFN